MSNTGKKFDLGKLRWGLLPFDALTGIIKVLEFGATKYGDRNWEEGMDWDRPFNATIRHLTAWYEGENDDEETGHSHLWHAGCCILFLIAYELRGVGHDNRPHGNDACPPLFSDEAIAEVDKALEELKDKTPAFKFKKGHQLIAKGVGIRKETVVDEDGNIHVIEHEV